MGLPEGNRHRINHRKQEDQTLVPADNWRNVPDIREKEISRILFNAVRKGVIVTFIADSCHSGSLARGATPRPVPALWSIETLTFRSVPNGGQK